MKNLTGQRFGRLIALEPTKERQYGSIVWKCQCECGNIKNISSRSLINGNTRSCGCLNREKATERIKIYNKENFKDLTGQKRGKLTILSATNLRKGSNIVWKCQCECGNITYVSTNGLNINGRFTKSCGCSHKNIKNYRDLLNQKFGKLLVIEKTNKRKHNQVVWKCQCECGNVIEVPSSSLTSNGTQSCGCLKSKGEEKIIKILQENSISFEKEKIFDFCKFDNNSYARFDFFVNKEFLIEYDGIQHFKQTGWDNLTEIQARDEFKNQWCKKNNIPLIRIPYTRYDTLNLKDLQLETSKFIVE